MIISKLKKVNTKFNSIIQYNRKCPATSDFCTFADIKICKTAKCGYILAVLDARSLAGATILGEICHG